MTRDAAAKRPGVLTKVGLGTFVDPELQGCAMNDAAAADPIVRRTEFDGDTWLYFPAIVPDVAIIRGTTADERGNISWEHEGAYLGALDQALAARNNGGIVIAQVKRRADTGTLKPMAVHVPGVLVDSCRRRAGAVADHTDRVRPRHLRRGRAARGSIHCPRVRA